MRGLLIPHARSRTLANGALAFADGDPVEGHSADNSGESRTLVANNTDAASQTIHIKKRYTADGAAFQDEVLNLAAGEIYVFDYFDNEYYGWDDPDNALTSKNALAIDVSSANVKLAWLNVGTRNTVLA